MSVERSLQPLTLIPRVREVTILGIFPTPAKVIRVISWLGWELSL